MTTWLLQALGLWSAVLAWLRGLSDRDLTLFMVVVGAAGWVLTQVLPPLARLIGKRLFGHPDSEVLLMEPETWTYIRWVPAEQIAIRWRPSPTGSESASGPTFRLKPLGPHPITEVSIRWKLRGVQPFPQFFESAGALKDFKPDKPGMGELGFGLTNGTHGIFLPTSDDATTEIPYSASSPNDQTAWTDVELHRHVMNSIAFRVIGSPYAGSYGFVSGYEIAADMRFRDPNGQHRRLFFITAEVIRCQDRSGGGLCGDLVAEEHQSPVNFRGAIKFVVKRATKWSLLRRALTPPSMIGPRIRVER